MKASVKSDYAFRAMEWLSVKYATARPVSIEQMARRQGIPSNYLVQILRELKSGGLIKSQRGKAGGYVLARSPEQITIADVFRAIQGDVMDISFVTDRSCPEELQRVWTRLKGAIEREAAAITFEQIVAAANGRAAMFEI